MTVRCFRKTHVLLTAFLLVFIPAVSWTDTLTVAAAANFQITMKEIIALYERSTPHAVTAVFGSSGALYMQIKNGAPFDVFLSADEERPRKCIADGLSIDSAPVTYAFGRLALWAPQATVGTAPRFVLDSAGTVAIAEPKVAPYGTAAIEALSAMGQNGIATRKAVFGRDVGQTYQFVASGNAYAGFIAFAQVLQTPVSKRGWYWIVPDSLYRPVRQCGVVLKQCRKPETARRFMEMLTGKDAQKYIEKAGYGTTGVIP
jgi:molybdate transport system substrate-binding protein